MSVYPQQKCDQLSLGKEIETSWYRWFSRKLMLLDERYIFIRRMQS